MATENLAAPADGKFVGEGRPLKPEINCTACQEPLTGGLDTFGPPDLPMCMDCHFGLSDDPRFALVDRDIADRRIELLIELSDRDSDRKSNRQGA